MRRNRAAGVLVRIDQRCKRSGRAEDRVKVKTELAHRLEIGPGTGGTPTAGNTPFPTFPAGGPSPTAGACVGDAASLSADALDHYQRAQDALKVQDWATYGREQALVEADLRCLQQVTR